MTFQKACEMIREEEDDMTQEIRALVVSQATAMYQNRIDKAVIRILAERPEIKDDQREYTEGIVDGLEWAVRILRGDKSAS